MLPIVARPLPPDSLLARHAGPEDHGDCYAAEVPGEVGLAAFVEAFYCSRGFLPERLFLYLLGRGASRADACRLARAETDRFAAWRVIARSEHELLLEDYLARTRSWLSVEPVEGGTRLCFGSGIMRREGSGFGARIERELFRALLPGHAAYSRVLLRSAAARFQ